MESKKSSDTFDSTTYALKKNEKPLSITISGDGNFISDIQISYKDGK
jgi:hypothetical protein